MVKASISRPTITENRAECSVAQANNATLPVELPGTARPDFARPAALVGGLGCALSVLTVGGMLAGAAGLTISALFCLAVIPVLGFTRSQLLLVSKGGDLSRTTEDIRLLMGIGMWAHRRPFAGGTAWTDRAATGALPGMPLTGEPGSFFAPVSFRTPDASAARGGSAAHQESGVPAGAGAPGEPGSPGARDGAAAPAPPAGSTGASTAGGRPPRTAATFWDVLSPAEQDELGRLASTVTFAPGDVVFHEGEPASHVLLLRSGQVKICLHRADGEQILALRGRGDLVGERAALEVSRRSATVEALDTVHTWVLRTDVFRAFLERRPHVIGLIEDQIYGRLTEENPATSGATLRPEHGHAQPAPAWTGQNCTIVYTDIASFSSHHRNDEDRRIIRRVMNELVRQACEESAVPWSACHHEDRGDGTLLVIPPDTPTGHAIDPLLTRLAEGLHRHNRRAAEVVRMQLRLALHVGPVVSDTGGVTGHAIIHTARLLDSPVLKAELGRSGADLGFITSPFVFEGSVRHGSGRPRATDFREVTFQVKESRGTAWMWLNGG